MKVNKIYYFKDFANGKRYYKLTEVRLLPYSNGRDYTFIGIRGGYCRMHEDMLIGELANRNIVEALPLAQVLYGGDK